MSKEALRSKVKLPVPARVFDELIACLKDENIIEETAGLCLSGFRPQFSNKQREIYERLNNLYMEAGFTPPDKGHAAPDKASAEVFDAMAGGELIPLGGEVFIHARHMDRAKHMIQEHCAGNKVLTLAQFRDMTASSRKYCLLILEYLDHHRFTRREGDGRCISEFSPPAKTRD